MRIPNATQESGPWRIHEIVPDFRLEDVWALPANGRAEDFQALVEQTVSADPSGGTSLPSRALWQARDVLGRWFGLGTTSPAQGDEDAAGKLPIPGTDQTSLRERLPEDLCNTAVDLEFASLPFVPLYRTDDEFAAEISNKTMHGVLHLAWVYQGDGRYQGQLAVYVKPRGLFGTGYMAFIKPFRLWVVYPALMRQIERTWEARVPQ